MTVSKGETTRQKIIEKAAPVFNERGFSGCSMQDVMEVTGLQKGGIYRHFASKEELASEVFRYSVDRALTARMAIPDENKNAIARLKQMVKAFVEKPSPVPGGCPLMNVAADIDSGSKVIADQAKMAVGAWKTRLCHILEEGIESHELRADIQPPKIANLLIATLEGALMISRLERNREALLDAQHSLDLLLSSLERAIEPGAP